MNTVQLYSLSSEESEAFSDRKSLEARQTFADRYESKLLDISLGKAKKRPLHIMVSELNCPVSESLSAISSDINERLNKRYSREDKQTIAYMIVDWLQEHGRLLKDISNTAIPIPYLLLDDGKAVCLNTLSTDVRLAISDAGLNMTEKVFSWTFAELQHRCLRNGIPVTLSKYSCHYKGKFYISSGPTKIVVVDIVEDDAVFTIVPNGYDGVLFCSECCLPYWYPTNRIKPWDSLMAFQPVLEAPCETKMYLPDIQMGLVECWLIAVLMQVRPLPILVTLGQFSSGKSTFAKALIKLFMGENADLATTPCSPRDYIACATSNLVYGLDNFDGPADKWLPDLLAQTSTGGMVKERLLYTNGEVYEKSLIAALMITTRTAAFANRPDILDRILPLFFGIRNDFSLSEKELLNEVIAYRDSLLTELSIRMMQVTKWNLRHSAPDNRFTEFGRIVYTMYPDEAEEMLKALHRAKRTSVNDDDSLLQAFLRYEGGIVSGNATQVVKHLDPDGTRIPYLGGGQKIARALREVVPTLVLNGWKIETSKGSGTTLFRFTPPHNN